MFNTTIIMPDFHPVSEAVAAQIAAEIQAMTNANKYTGEELHNFNKTDDTKTVTKTVERWNWVDEASAIEYVNVSIAAIQPEIPGVTAQISPV